MQHGDVDISTRSLNAISFFFITFIIEFLIFSCVWCPISSTAAPPEPTRPMDFHAEGFLTWPTDSSLSNLLRDKGGKREALLFMARTRYFLMYLSDEDFFVVVFVLSVIYTGKVEALEKRAGVLAK